MFPILGPSLILSIILCVHVVRTNQPMYWLWIILVIPWLGAIIYLIAVVLPGLVGGPAARGVSRIARDTLDPNREYRTAKAACDDVPTVQNQMRLAKAAASLGRHAEAEALFGQAAQGIHALDPILLLGRATALIELGRADEALPLLQATDPQSRTPAADLALGRAYEALGRIGEAESAYQLAAGRLPGLEGLGRYAAFLARHGRADEAREAVVEMDRRIAGANPQFRNEGRAWRDLAARALAAG